MAMWEPALATAPGTRAEALVRAIGDDIRSGVLKPGDRLPPQRDLAYRLGLSANTVMRAYAEAARRGYVEGAVGRGTFVRSPGGQAGDRGGGLLRPTDREPIDFSQNLPFPGAAAGLLAETLQAIARSGDMASYLDHQDASILQRHRNAGAIWIAAHGRPTTPETVVLANGAQQGVFAALLALLRSGDTLLVEELVYPPVKAMARHLGVRLRPVGMDEEGLLPDMLEAACRSGPARLLYCTPTLQTPTAATMSEDRRRRIAAVARSHDLTIVEDDVFGMLPHSRPIPLAAFAQERTVLVTSVSKSVAPGLRVGYVRAPAQLVPAVHAAVALSSWMPPPLMAEIASRWIEDGTAVHLNAAQRRHAADRQAMAHRILADRPIRSRPEGSHLWLGLPAHVSDTEICHALRLAGVLVQPTATFAVSRREPDAIRLCLSHESCDDRVAAGLTLVHAATSPGAVDARSLVI